MGLNCIQDLLEHRSERYRRCLDWSLNFGDGSLRGRPPHCLIEEVEHFLVHMLWQRFVQLLAS